MQWKIQGIQHLTSTVLFAIPILVVAMQCQINKTTWSHWKIPVSVSSTKSIHSTCWLRVLKCCWRSKLWCNAISAEQFSELKDEPYMFANARQTSQGMFLSCSIFAEKLCHFASWSWQCNCLYRRRKTNRPPSWSSLRAVRDGDAQPRVVEMLRRNVWWRKWWV